jgi:hypothetical protein
MPLPTPRLGRKPPSYLSSIGASLPARSPGAGHACAPPRGCHCASHHAPLFMPSPYTQRPPTPCPPPATPRAWASPCRRSPLCTCSLPAPSSSGWRLHAAGSGGPRSRCAPSRASPAGAAASGRAAARLHHRAGAVVPAGRPPSAPPRPPLCRRRTAAARAPSLPPGTAARCWSAHPTSSTTGRTSSRSGALGFDSFQIDLKEPIGRARDAVQCVASPAAKADLKGGPLLAAPPPPRAGSRPATALPAVPAASAATATARASQRAGARRARSRSGPRRVAVCSSSATKSW